jgi:hypothetical protein
VAAHDASDREELLETGADLVIDPFQGAADHAVALLTGPPQGTPASESLGGLDYGRALGRSDD